MPKVEWTQKTMRWALVFLPLIGIIIAAVVILWHYCAALLELGSFLYGVGLVLIPLLITGGVHMDGFCDTVDALASNSDIETRQRILKDSSTGAFAVFGAVAYLLAFAALGSELKDNGTLVWSLGCLFMMSRCLAGLSTVWFPTARTSGLAYTFADGASKMPTRIILLVLTALASAVVMWIGGIPGLVAVLCCLLTVVVLRFWLIGQFGGLSGDLIGWFIQMCELCALAGLVVAFKMIALF